jgi:integrase
VPLNAGGIGEMAAKLEKTKTPGVYRRGSRYAVTYRAADGRQRWESARTFDEARDLLSARRTAAAQGKYEERMGIARPAEDEEEPILLHVYAREWIDRYHGNGKRGFREETRAEYRSMLERYTLKHFPDTMTLQAVSPKLIADFIGWLVKRPNQRGGTLTDKTIRNALTPLMACLATAKREGLIRDNPATGAALPHRPTLADDEADVPRPFPRIGEVETMELVVQLVHPKHRVMFELLAATGLRRSELLALEVRHLHLNGDSPSISVRQRSRTQRGKGPVIGPLKSRYARRDLPIPLDLADRLRTHVAGREPTALAFSGFAGKPYDPGHVHSRILAPACAEAGVEWAGFHTFRHTVATRMFAAGRNAVQVQHWLGHHSAAFTIATYVHLLDGDLGGPLEPRQGANKVRTGPTPNGDTTDIAVSAESLN